MTVLFPNPWAYRATLQARGGGKSDKRLAKGKGACFKVIWYEYAVKMHSCNQKHILYEGSISPSHFWRGSQTRELL